MFPCTKKFNSLQKSIRDSYCPLLFQKILRNYQKPEQSITKHKIILKDKQIIKQNGVQKQIVDLNKKLKIKRFMNKQEEANKQNIQDNGATQYQFSTSSMNKKQQAELMLTNRQFNVHQFKHEEQYQDSLIEHQQNNVLESIKQNDENLNNQMEKQIIVELMNQKMDEMIDQGQHQQLNLNKIRQQIQSCNIINQQKINPPTDRNNSSFENKIEINQQRKLQYEYNKQVKKDTSHHIKNKISLRILKKKLQILTPEEVVQDLVNHRKIQLDGINSKPQKKAVCEALLSFLKNQLID